MSITNNNDRIIKLLQLTNPKKTSKQKIDILNQLETIQGYDLIFILSLIIRGHFSGNLIVVNEDNLLSGINFIYGDIIKVDYHDKENLLGHLVVESEMLSKFEMQDIIEKTGGARLGDYLVNNGHLTQAQLRKILFKQTTQRLTKYITSMNIRLKFTFDSESNDNVLINRIDYHDILYHWIFTIFEDNWFNEYGEFYQKSTFVSQLDTEQLQLLKDYPQAYDLAFKISQLKKTVLSYHELFKLAHTTRIDFFKTIHFLILAGIISIDKNKELALAEMDDEKRIELLAALEEDLKQVHVFLLHKKYYEAFGLINKYTSMSKSHPKLSFYAIWIKLVGAYYHKHMIDIKKIHDDFNRLDYSKHNIGEYYYVRSLLHLLQNQNDEALYAFNKACKEDHKYSRFPFKPEEESILDKFTQLFKFNK